ncbi:MAG: ABC transporter permease [Acidilobus sp.]|jgi:peptide/nickel transport system permease protein
MHVGGAYKLVAVYINPRLTGAARQQQIQMLIQKFHLNQPVYVQYFYWLASIFQGNLGYTNTPIFSGPVTQAIALFFPNTALLAVLGGILTWLLGIPLGTWSAVRRDKPDDVAIRVFSYTLYGMPLYLIAVLLIIIFAVWLKVLPLAGTVSAKLLVGLPWYKNGISYPTHVLLIDALIHGNWNIALDALEHIILPSLTIALAVMAGIINILRASMLEVLEQDYVRFARSKGLPERIVINKHARPTAMFPVYTNFAYTVAGLLGGVVIVETVFNYPGIGYWLTQSMLNNDMGGIMAGTLLFGIVFVTTSLVLDIVFALKDPRVRLG